MHGNVGCAAVLAELDVERGHVGGEDEARGVALLLAPGVGALAGAVGGLVVHKGRADDDLALGGVGDQVGLQGREAVGVAVVGAELGRLGVVEQAVEVELLGRIALVDVDAVPLHVIHAIFDRPLLS